MKHTSNRTIRMYTNAHRLLSANFRGQLIEFGLEGLLLTDLRFQTIPKVAIDPNRDQ